MTSYLTSLSHTGLVGEEIAWACTGVGTALVSSELGQVRSVDVMFTEH